MKDLGLTWSARCSAILVCLVRTGHYFATLIRIHSPHVIGFDADFFHSGERIQKHSDTCGRGLKGLLSLEFFQHFEM